MVRSWFVRARPRRRAGLPVLSALATAGACAVLALPAHAADAADGEPASSTAARITSPESAAAPYDAPLEVSIDELTPGVLPRKGPIVLQGWVTNVDLEPWREITVFPMIGASPGCVTCDEVLTSPGDLATAAGTDPTLPVGDRDPAVASTIDELAPGESAHYTLRIPQKELRRLFADAAPGVYWFGAHALGTSDTTPSDSVADGRARTFLPVLPRRLTEPKRAITPVDTAVVVPLRAEVTHAADGSIDDLGHWQTGLTPTGHLGGPLAFGAASEGRALSWLVDPAVTDAVEHIARGNLPREIVPTTPAADPDASEGPTPSDNGEGGDDGDNGDDAQPAPTPQAPAALMTAADTWLTRAQAELAEHEVLALPYGDPDLDATAETLPRLYATARKHPTPVLDRWKVATTPAVRPPDGYLTPQTFSTLDDDATVLLDSRVFSRETYGRKPPTDALVGQHPVVVTSRAAATGGPGPDAALAPVALRQRLLSEAAVRMLAARGGRPEPLTVVLPSTVSATDAATFWEGLEQPWLRLVPVSEVAPSASGSTSSQQLDLASLSEPVRHRELPPSLVYEAGQLLRAARSLQSVLGDDYRIGDELSGEALTGVSYSTRDARAAERLIRTRGWVEEQLQQITVDAPAGVSLSSSSGGFNVAVRNGLDHPVTVHLEAVTDDGARITVVNPIHLGARSRSSVPVHAQILRSGVHNLTLRLTDPDGQPLGAADTVPVRSGQSSVVIWAVMGAGVAILFVAIAIRLVRRIRRRGDPEPEPAGPTDTESPDTGPAEAPSGETTA